MVEEYNQGLMAAVENYEIESGANIDILDVNGLFEDITAEPGAYGFVNVEEPVLSSKTPVTGEPIAYNDAIVGEDPAVQHSTLFLDPYFHPTALGHSIVAETARGELLNLGEDFAEPTPESTELTPEATELIPEEAGLSIELYDADENTLIASLEDGMQIQASDLAGKNLAISASVPEDSVYFEQIESVFLELNDGESLNGGINLQGENTIAFELYPQDELGGEMLDSTNVDFSVA